MKLNNFFYCFFLLLLVASCNEINKEKLVTNSGETQGTFYYIKYINQSGYDLHSKIDSLLFLVDNSLSTYNENSLLSKINKNNEFIVDFLIKEVFLKSKEISKETDGFFDCSVAPLVNAWGFGFSQKEKMDSIKVKQLLNIVGFNKIDLKNDSIIKPIKMLLDFNSIAQGYTVDLVAKLLEINGVNNYLIEIGGEIRSKGKNPSNKLWTIGVDKPNEEIDPKDRFQFILELKNKSLATSGNYRKFFIEDGTKYSHIINPKTGFPAKNRLLSVTVIHDNCMEADAYATAFMVMGLQKSKEFIYKKEDLEVYFVYSNMDGELESFITEKFEKRIID
tara:strand:+ start:408 stop:1409 length:1002 start_codon:yes stop_codon:yes gene_type:complete